MQSQAVAASSFAAAAAAIAPLRRAAAMACMETALERIATAGQGARLTFGALLVTRPAIAVPGVRAGSAVSLALRVTTPTGTTTDHLELWGFVLRRTAFALANTFSLAHGFPDAVVARRLAAVLARRLAAPGTLGHPGAARGRTHGVNLAGSRGAACGGRPGSGAGRVRGLGFRGAGPEIGERERMARGMVDRQAEETCNAPSTCSSSPDASCRQPGSSSIGSLASDHGRRPAGIGAVHTDRAGRRSSDRAHRPVALQHVQGVRLRIAQRPQLLARREHHVQREHGEVAGHPARGSAQAGRHITAALLDLPGDEREEALGVGVAADEARGSSRDAPRAGAGPRSRRYGPAAARAARRGACSRAVRPPVEA